MASHSGMAYSELLQLPLNVTKSNKTQVPLGQYILVKVKRKKSILLCSATIA